MYFNNKVTFYQKYI